MEDSVSNFPIVFQHEPGRGRHRDGSSTFVRAHVMERYHRMRKVNPSKNADTRLQSLWELGDDNPYSIPLSSRRGKPQKVPKPVTVSADFVEYSKPSPGLAPTHDGRERVKVEEKDSCVAVVTRQKMKERSTSMERSLGEGSPMFTRLQLRDPREQESSKFMEVFKAYSQILKDRQAPLDPLSKTWLSSAFTDLALFHAILFNFSQHLYALCSLDHEKPSLLKHKVNAIRQISARMETPVLACADPIIASILCLVSHEFLNGDAVALQAHLKGLRQIIAVRGDVHLLGFDGTLKTIYLSYEVLLATVFKSWATNLPPLTSISCRVSSFTVDPYQARQNIFTLGQNSMDSITHSFSNESIQLLAALERKFALPDISINSDICLDHPLYSACVEELNLDLHPAGEKETDTSIDHAFASLRLAISLHFADPDSQVLTRRLVTELKYHLTKTFLQSLWHPIPGALLFCLIVGGAASKGSPERPWFVANLIRATTGLAFENWEGLKNTLCFFSVVGVVD